MPKRKQIDSTIRLGVQISIPELQRLERDSWSHDTFTRQVIAIARGNGFKVAHFRPAETKHGWRTAVQGDGKGFPDVVAINKRRRLGIAWELKVHYDRPTKEQLEWIDYFDAIGFCSRVCRVENWEFMMAVLEGRIDTIAWHT